MMCLLTTPALPNAGIEFDCRLAYVGLGMATGIHQRFYKGETTLTAVIVVQALGALCLVLLTRGLLLCAAAWRDRPRRRVAWPAMTLVLCWLTWMFFRVAEYSS